MSKRFQEFNLRPESRQALEDAGYEATTPIQEQAIPILLEGKDLIGVAQTGTGKTLAFLLPIFEKIEPGGADPQAVVICPTRELAIQVAGEAERFGKHLGIRVVLAYGGTSSGSQKQDTFLGIEESKELDSPANLARMRRHVESMAPDIVIMPIGKDPNQTHAWVHQVFRECAKDLTLKKEKPVIALYNEDPKTMEMRKDLFVLFGEESADWKRGLLRAHHSQQQRNIHSRGTGFDERILRMNHLSYRSLQEMLPPVDGSAKYAEVFEIELFGFRPRRAKS